MTNAERTDWDAEFRNGGGSLSELPESDGIAVLKPGDKLVLRYRRLVNDFEAAQIKTRCSERLPGVEAVIISGCDAWMIHREEASRAE